MKANGRCIFTGVGFFHVEVKRILLQFPLKNNEDSSVKAMTYRLAAGTQVREEDFGLFFYTMKRPRLYFLSSGPLPDGIFFRVSLPLFISLPDCYELM